MRLDYCIEIMHREQGDEFMRERRGSNRIKFFPNTLGILTAATFSGDF